MLNGVSVLSQCERENGQSFLIQFNISRWLTLTVLPSLTLTCSSALGGSVSI